MLHIAHFQDHNKENVPFHSRATHLGGVYVRASHRSCRPQLSPCVWLHICHPLLFHTITLVYVDPVGILDTYIRASAVPDACIAQAHRYSDSRFPCFVSSIENDILSLKLSGHVERTFRECWISNPGALLHCSSDGVSALTPSSLGGDASHSSSANPTTVASRNCCVHSALKSHNFLQCLES